MRQLRIPAVFMRGGTSNALVFRASDLPTDRAVWPGLFLAALGSPDPNGRQLDGMGGGISSLSKVCVVGPPSRADADIDFSFFQVAVGEPKVDTASNCGNMSSAMGPFAIDAGLVRAEGPRALVRIHNTNTGKLIHAHFDLDEGEAAVEGDFVLPGVAGTGAPVRLEFRDPGGAGTGRLLPTGNAVDRLDVPTLGTVEMSIVDAACTAVFVDAQTLDLDGAEMPAALDAMPEVMRRLEAIRLAAAAAMGIAAQPTLPRVGIVAPPRDSATLSGARLQAADCDLTGRMVSMGNVHRALPLTGALCLAVAARIEGTIVHRAAHRAARPAADPTADIRIAQPSGLSVVAAAVARDAGGAWLAEQATVYRTQRRLFEGAVLLPAGRVRAPAGIRTEAAD